MSLAWGVLRSSRAGRGALEMVNTAYINEFFLQTSEENKG